MTQPRQNRGTSLVELLITMGLFLAAMGLITGLFLMTTRFTSMGDERSDLDGLRLVALAELRRAMSHSHQSGNSLFYNSANPANGDLVLCLISTIGPTGVPDWDEDELRPMFHRYEVYFLDQASSELRRLDIPLTPTYAADALPDTTVRAAIAAGGPTTLVCPEVVRFEAFVPVTGDQTDTWANPLGLRLLQNTSRDTPMVGEIAYSFPNL